MIKAHCDRCGKAEESGAGGYLPDGWSDLPGWGHLDPGCARLLRLFMGGADVLEAPALATSPRMTWARQQPGTVPLDPYQGEVNDDEFDADHGDETDVTMPEPEKGVYTVDPHEIIDCPYCDYENRFARNEMVPHMQRVHNGGGGLEKDPLAGSFETPGPLTKPVIKLSQKPASTNPGEHLTPPASKHWHNVGAEKWVASGPDGALWHKFSDGPAHISRPKCCTLWGDTEDE